MPINQRLMAKLKVNGHSSVVWYWSGDPMVPRSNPLLVRKFLLLSLLIWKGGFEILPNNTWDLLKKAYGTSKKLRFQFRGQLNKPFSEPTYLYTNLSCPSSKFWGLFGIFRAIVLKISQKSWYLGFLSFLLKNDWSTTSEIICNIMVSQNRNQGKERKFHW